MRVRGWVVVATAIALTGCETAEPPGAQDGAPPTTPAVASTPVPSHPAAESTQAPATATNTRSYRYRCGEDAVVARFQAQHAEVTVGGHTLVLEQAPSGSGTRYADTAGNEFWSKGQSEATLTLAGASPLHCTRAARRPAGPDVEFTATGNEPGWIARITRGDRPTLHAEVDYGERTFDVTTLHATPGRWRGTAPDGTSLTLTFERRACQDSMSGMAFEATATLQVGNRTYEGCGAFAAE